MIAVEIADLEMSACRAVKLPLVAIRDCPTPDSGSEKLRVSWERRGDVGKEVGGEVGLELGRPVGPLEGWPVGVVGCELGCALGRRVGLPEG